jgi:serine/threonine-protein phosphatase PGAM5
MTGRLVASGSTTRRLTAEALHRTSFVKMLRSLALVVFALSLAWVLPVSGEQARSPRAGIRTLYLIRHGAYDPTDTTDPENGPGLVPLGIAQARLVAARLRALPVEMTSLHSSTMTRAQQTALVIGTEFPDLALQQSDLLRECTPPTRRGDVMSRVGPERARGCRDALDRAFGVYFTPSPDADRHDVIVCHGNVIRYFVTRVLEVDPEAWLGMSIGNCSLTVVRVSANGTMMLMSYNDMGHMPPNLQTQTSVDNSGRFLAVPGD